MDIAEIKRAPVPLDIVVGGDGSEILVEIDVRNNSRIKIGDWYYAPGTGYSVILRVVGVAFANGYDPMTARQTNAMREGVVSSPRSYDAKKMFQRKLARMIVEGELTDEGRRSIGIHHLPERLTLVFPLTDEMFVQFHTENSGNMLLGLLKSGERILPHCARVSHNFAGERMVILGMPGSGKSQLARGILSQLMVSAGTAQQIGLLVLDRAGEYVENTITQEGHTVFGLQNHPHATEKLVVISRRQKLAQWERQKQLYRYLPLTFNITDIAPIDLVDFYPGFSSVQKTLLRDYAYDPDLYKKLFSETRLGNIDRTHWYHDFPGLFELNKNGKQLLKQFEMSASEGDTLNPEQLQELQAYLGGSKSKVLERVILSLKRFAQNPILGGKRRGSEILSAESVVDETLDLLGAGKMVIIDMRGISDSNYTLVAALFARKLLDENKRRNEEAQIRACLVMEEAHNILSENELQKGGGKGSVFIEYAREGRKMKLGLLMVTQQADTQSIAPSIASTIDTMVAFHMSPDNTKALKGLKSGFKNFDRYLSNATTFSGVVVSKKSAISFHSIVTNSEYMVACAKGLLPQYLKLAADVSRTTTFEKDNTFVSDGATEPISRLEELLSNRHADYQKMVERTFTDWKLT